MKKFALVIKKCFIVAFAISLLLLTQGAGYDYRPEVYLGGIPLGIELESSGVVVTDTFQILTTNGVFSPAKDAGILVDDVILEVNGTEIKSAKDISNKLKECNDKESIMLKIGRKGAEKLIFVNPVMDSVSNELRIGVSVSEGISGVGTLTFITKDGKFGGLGHKISDESSRVAQNSGKIYKCSIFEVKRGIKGKPGELHGIFHADQGAVGDIVFNDNFGIFGQYFGKTDGLQAIPVARSSEIECGPAYIYSTLSGDVSRRYEVRIEQVNDQNEPKEKGLVIKITDKRLLEKSGGIVRGMSGSPIVQNGRLVGAVTHVLVNDPTSGFGIFIGNMLGKAESVASK